MYDDFRTKDRWSGQDVHCMFQAVITAISTRHADAVDISTIFRDFRNDPARPENYEFAATDDYLAAIVQTGSPLFYRLGESIEHTPRKYRVHPPKDFAKCSWRSTPSGR